MGFYWKRRRRSFLSDYLTYFLANYKNIILFIWLLSLVLCLIRLYSHQDKIVETVPVGAVHTDAYQVEQYLEQDFGYRPDLTAALVIEGNQSGETLRKKILKQFPQIAKIAWVHSYSHHQHQLYALEFKHDIPLGESQALVKEIRQL